MKPRKKSPHAFSLGQSVIYANLMGSEPRVEDGIVTAVGQHSSFKIELQSGETVNAIHWMVFGNHDELLGLIHPVETFLKSKPESTPPTVLRRVRQ